MTSKKKKSQAIARRKSNKRPIDLWTDRITSRWRESLQAILSVGQLLRQAKEKLPHGEFGKMCDSRLPFGSRTAQMLIAIAADPRLNDPAHAERLPPSWGTLYDLTRLDDAAFKAAIEDNVIRPDMERKEVVNGARAIMGSRVEPDDSLDYFPTPPWATRALIERVLPQLGHRADFSECSAFEPACGEGHIAEVVAEYAKSVRASDVFAYGYGEIADFLQPKPADLPRADWIITNPPFGDKAEAFILRALECARVGVAMFLRLQWLETVGRYERVFNPFPPALIAQFAERVPLHKGRWEPDGDTATAYLWIVWIKGKKGRTQFFWIPPGCREQLAREDDRARFTAHPVDKRARPRRSRQRPGPKPKQLSLLPALEPSRTTSLVSPKLLPSAAQVAAIADRAEKRKRARA